ncbi:MAG: homoserine dehydrogenase [Clostridia bacterium]|nr:homoserine dehydrogenase [Clostridia bacterium]
MAINLAILGFGVIGSGVAEVLTENKKLIESRIGSEINIKYILDLRDFKGHPLEHLVVHDFDIILNDPEVSVVAEMMGGSHPAYDFSKACIEAGKSVVTSNKEVVATFGAELQHLAAQHGVRYLFEASVGGGIPIIRPMMHDLQSNEIVSVSGILNGTTNYILTQMIENGVSFESALHDAQLKGYAEKDPTADVEGLDAARKIVILAALAFGTILRPNEIHVEGISRLTLDDVKVAEAFGASLKLIGHTEKIDGRVLCMVSPRVVPKQNPLSGVSDVFNGVLVDANMVDKVMFYGRGAGKLPTASAVVADLIDVWQTDARQVAEVVWTPASNDTVADFASYVCRSLVIYKGTADSASALSTHFGGAEVKAFPALGLLAVMTEELTEEKVDALSASAPLPFVKRIRVLG